ncbi:MAG: hypothetical protein K2O55_03250, partial [Alistipes sp.]|nr:hypothetical protein [Alistipes sp.]
IKGAGRRRWQRRALRLKNLFSYRHREELKALAKPFSLRHREASQMPWRSEQEQRPGGYDSNKDDPFLFRLPRSLHSLAMTGGATPLAMTKKMLRPLQ